MVILHTETLKKWGGQQNRVLSEAIGLSKRGHKFIIACHKSSMLAQKAKEAGIKVYEVNMVKQAYLLTIPQLIRIIKKEKVDLVCTHSSVDSWAGGIAARLTRRRLVRFKHNLYRVKKDPPTRFIYSLPHRFISVNNAAAEVLKETGYIRPEKITRVYGSIDSEKFNPDKISNTDKAVLKRSLGIPQNALVIGNTSGFTEVKGQYYLLEAANTLFNRNNGIYIVLIGGMGQKEKVHSLVVKPEFHNRVILPGHRTDIPQLLSIMDIFVFPSTVEAFGNSLLEAMAMAKPVVVSDIPSFREFMSDGLDGIFFRAKDPADLAKKVILLIENGSLRSKLGENARYIVEKFSPDKMLSLTEALYREVLDAP